MIILYESRGELSYLTVLLSGAVPVFRKLAVCVVVVMEGGETQARNQGSTSREWASSLPQCSGLGLQSTRRKSSPPRRTVGHKEKKGSGAEYRGREQLVLHPHQSCTQNGLGRAKKKVQVGLATITVNSTGLY